MKMQVPNVKFVRTIYILIGTMVRKKEQAIVN